MKVVFVRPLRTLEQSYGRLAAAGSTEASQGLCSLAAVTRDAGIDTEVVDATIEGLSNEAAAERVLQAKPSLVGLSSVTAAVHDAAAIASIVKERAPNTTTAIGGVHVTAVPDETLRAFPSFDLAAVGEGEDTVLELVEALGSGADLSAVRGLVLRDGDELVHTESRPFIRPLDRLPFPAWDMLPGYPQCCRPPAWSPRQGEAGLVITSRGCTGRCTFCDRKCFGTVCRAHSADYVLELVTHLRDRFGIRYLRFLDDNFLLWPRRLRRICEGMIDRGMDFTWSCFGRVDTVDEDILELMKAAGCQEISYGIESGSQRILGLIQKDITLDQVRHAVAATHNVGIGTIGFFMLGHPTETRETIMETIAFARELPLDYFKALYVTPFPGSELYQQADRYGTLEPDWRRLSTYHCPFVPHGMTREELVRFRKLMFRRFYLRPRVVARQLVKALNPRYAVQLARGAWSLLRFWSSREAT